MSESQLLIPQEFEPVADAVAVWIAGYPREFIFSAMLIMAGTIAQQEHPQIPFTYLDPRKRLLCEMPLCGTLDTIRPPAGFDYKHGYVITVNRQRSRQHQFYLHLATDVVLCPTFGQFGDMIELGNRFDGRGSRVELMRLLIPEDAKNIVIINDPFSPEFAFLLATRTAIKNHLGIEYKTHNDATHIV